MPLTALVCAALLALGDEVTPPQNLVAEYQQARAAAGRSPAEQVRLALWCEAHGLTAERMRHLALALLADPTNAMARGLSGLVSREGRWVAPDAVAQTVRNDAATQALLTEYDLRRSRAAYTADAQWTLGQWASDQGLTEQARAHFTAVTRLDPSRDLPWKRLGFKKHEGRWTTDTQLAAVKAEADAQKQADRTWKPLLEKWRGMLAKANQREEARAALLAVTDPRAVASIARVFSTDRPADQQVAVGLLGQIESPQSSRMLAALAVLSPSPEVRRTALETLRRRDPRDFIGLWIAAVRDPIQYKVQQVAGPGSPGSILISGQKANRERIYRPMNAPTTSLGAGQFLDRDENGMVEIVAELGYSASIYALYNQSQFDAMKQQNDAYLRQVAQSLNHSAIPKPAATEIVNALANASFTSTKNVDQLTKLRVTGGEQTPGYTTVYDNQLRIPIGQMMAESARSAVAAQAQLASDVATLDRQNALIHQANEPVLMALGELTGEHLGEDSTRWNQWWVNQQGYALMESSTNPVPTFVENVPISFTPSAVPFVSSQVIGLAHPHHSCFGAGTLVRTIAGTKAIEQVVRGDLVLVQNTHSGALAYQPVLTAFHNPPSATYRVKLGDDEVVATGIHRFWRVARGWTMARDLKVGDSVRTLGGLATVAAIRPEAVQPVFNLEVAEGGSFFVGQVGALVHDNSLVEATPNPFDAVSAVTLEEKRDARSDR